MREIQLPTRHSAADVELAERVAVAFNSGTLRVFAATPGPPPVTAAAPPPRPLPSLGDATIAVVELALLGAVRLLRGVLRV